MSIMELRNVNSDSFFTHAEYEADRAKEEARNKLEYLADASNWIGKEWDSDLDLVSKPTNTYNFFHTLSTFFYSSTPEKYDIRASKSTLAENVKKNVEAVNALYLKAYPSFDSEKEFQKFEKLQNKILININTYIIREGLQLPSYSLLVTKKLDKAQVEDKPEEAIDTLPIEYNEDFNDDSSVDEISSMKDSLVVAKEKSSFDRVETTSSPKYNYKTRLRSSIPSRRTTDYYKQVVNGKITPFKFR